MITDFEDATEGLHRFLRQSLRITKNIEEGESSYTSNSKFENVRSGQLYLYIVIQIDPCLLAKLAAHFLLLRLRMLFVRSH